MDIKKSSKKKNSYFKGQDEIKMEKGQKVDFDSYSYSSKIFDFFIHKNNQIKINTQVKRNKLKNSGQVTVEYILLAVALLVLFQVATKTLKDNETLKHFQETPQKIFQNMVENGNWKPDGIDSRKHHPNHYEFQYTSDGDGPIP